MTADLSEDCHSFVEPSVKLFPELTQLCANIVRHGVADCTFRMRSLSSELLCMLACIALASTFFATVSVHAQSFGDIIDISAFLRSLICHQC